MRWRDVSQYKLIGNPRNALETMSDGTLRNLTAQTLWRTAHQKPEQFSVALIKYLRHASRRFGRNLDPKQLKTDLTTLQSIHIDTLSEDLRYVCASLALYIEAADLGLSEAVSTETGEELLTSLKRTIIPSDDPSMVPESVASNIIFGKLYSYTNRVLAAEHFQRARNLDSGNFLARFYVDLGARTYFTESDVRGNEANARTADILKSIEPVSSRQPTNDTSIVISVDATFFRIYAPTFLYYAQQLPDIDHSIVLCASEEEAWELSEDGNKLLHALDAVNNGGVAPNVHYYRAPVPEFAIEPKTFYASARFYAATLLLQRYSSVTLLDADLTADIDPRPHIRKTKRHSIAAVKSGGYTALSPWRRYMAGNVVVSSGDKSHNALSDMQRYLSLGLGLTDNWMLDQNALAFTVERNLSSFYNLGGAPRPYTQKPFRETWEKNYRRSIPAV
ncbi:hypothetical protein GCM10009625_19030 [Brachybacterium fresconis]|uniref:Uncharacterized protein n=2 Tax=Brachybacterium fresconis TaxID=173363 RepID=A0ABS4YJV7_9MICO|nr:hypothetical protein [Brachybacterium fresconis]